MHLCTGFSQRKHKEKEVKTGSHLLPKARKESFLPGYSRLMETLCCSLPRAKLCSLGLGCATGCGGEERQAVADGHPRLLGLHQGVIYTAPVISPQQGHCKLPLGLTGALCHATAALC